MIITRLLGLGVGWVGLVGLDLGFDVVVWLFVMLCFAGWCICLLWFGLGWVALCGLWFVWDWFVGGCGLFIDLLLCLFWVCVGCCL